MMSSKNQLSIWVDLKNLQDIKCRTYGISGFFKVFIKVFNNNNIVDGLKGEILCISRCLIAWGSGTNVTR